MKRAVILAVLILQACSFAAAQVTTERCWHLDRLQFLDQRQDFWRSHKIFTTGALPYSRGGGGLYSLTEGQYGFGLVIIEPPFAHHVAGVTSAIGWRSGSGFAIGGGAGYLKYNDGYTVPLFADLRYFFGRQRVQFFIAMPTGFMLNFANFRDYSKVFANPSLGLIVPVLRNTHLSFSTGLMTQIDREIFDDPGFNGPWHDSFINLKLGLLFGW